MKQYRLTNIQGIREPYLMDLEAGSIIARVKSARRIDTLRVNLQIYVLGTLSALCIIMLLLL